MISNCLPDLEFFFFLNIFDAVLGVIIWKELCKIGGTIDTFAKIKMQDWFLLIQGNTLNLLFGQPKIWLEFQKSKHLHLCFLLLSVFENILEKNDTLLKCVNLSHTNIQHNLWAITFYDPQLMAHELWAIKRSKTMERCWI